MALTVINHLNKSLVFSEDSACQGLHPTISADITPGSQALCKAVATRLTFDSKTQVREAPENTGSLTVTSVDSPAM